MSELYATMLMVGVTLSLGSVVTAAAVGAFGQTEGAASMGASLQESAFGVRLSLVYATVAPSGGCQAYEGTNITLALYDYGAAGFTPVELAVNSTVYGGGFQAVQPGALVLYSVALGSCAHASGQTIVVVDGEGDEVQLES